MSLGDILLLIAFVALCLVSSVLAKRLAGKNIVEVAKFVLSGM